MRDERFSQLCRSLEADPDFLEQRPILAQLDGTVFAGNHRLLAARHLGWATVPAIIADVPDELAKQRAMIDNNNAADWEDDSLSNLLAELQAGATDLSLLGFEGGELERLLAQADGRVVDPDYAMDEWQGMPEFEQKDQEAHRTVYVHFEDDNAVADFARLVGQTISAETKSVWYPEQRPRRLGVYVADES